MQVYLTVFSLVIGMLRRHLDMGDRTTVQRGLFDRAAGTVHAMKTSRLIPLALTSLVLAGCGTAGGDTTAVPDLSGKRLNAARTSAEKKGFQLNVEQQGDGSTSRARVCSQKPKPGVKLNPAIDSNITVTVRRNCG